MVALPIIAIVAYVIVRLLYQYDMNIPYYSSYKEHEVHQHINEIDDALELYASEHIINGHPSYPKNLPILVDEHYIDYETVYDIDTQFVYVAYPINKERYKSYILRTNKKFDTDYIYSKNSIQDKNELYREK